MLVHDPQNPQASFGLGRVLLLINHRTGVGEEYYNQGVRALADYWLNQAKSSFAYTSKYLPGLDVRLFPVAPDRALLRGHLLEALQREYQSPPEVWLTVLGIQAPRLLRDDEIPALLHTRDALGEAPTRSAREFLAPEGRLAFVRPVKVLSRPPPGMVEQWERHLGHPLRTPQELLAGFPAAGYEPDFAETLGVDEMEALYAAAPDEVAEEAALYRGGAAAISFALAVGRRREPDEKPRPSRDRG